MDPFTALGLGIIGVGSGLGGGLWWLKNRAKPTDPYDLVININSINGLCRPDEGWRIDVNVIEPPALPQSPPPESLPLEQLVLPLRVPIGVLGNFNGGKTWFISKFANRRLMSGDLVHTQGLSVLFGDPAGRELHNLIFLDTAGSNVPVPPGDIEDYVATEAFLRDLTIELSDIIVIVVNRLGLSDQKFILSVADNLSEGKDLWVLHNLSNVKTEADCEKVIQDDILKMGGEERTKSLGATGAKKLRYWIEENVGRRKLAVRHFVMARDDSNIGEKINNETLELMRSYIEPARPFNLLQRTRDFTQTNLKFFVEGNPEVSLIPQDRCFRATSSEEVKLRPLVFEQTGFFLHRFHPMHKVSQYIPEYAIYQTDSEYIVLAEIASCHSLQYTVTNQTFRITGVRSALQPDWVPVRGRQIPDGSFSLEDNFPGQILPVGKIQAYHEHGIYEIHIPKLLTNYSHSGEATSRPSPHPSSSSSN